MLLQPRPRNKRGSAWGGAEPRRRTPATRGSAARQPPQPGAQPTTKTMMKSAKVAASPAQGVIQARTYEARESTIETIGRVEQKLWPTLFTEREAGYFSSLSPGTVALETTLFFSAKESFYKCQYPLTKEWVGFQDVAITRTDQHALAIAPTRGAAQAWHAAPIHTAEISESHVATVMLLRA